MNTFDKERFEKLVEDREYLPLVDLCKSVMIRNENLEKENIKLKENKKSISVTLLEMSKGIFSDLEILFKSILLISLAIGAMILLVTLSLYIFMPTTPLDRYYISTCNEKSGLEVSQQVRWGHDLSHSGCITTPDQEPIAREILERLKDVQPRD